MTNIRQKMEEALKEEFRELVLQIHGREELTQIKLANALLMDRRSLADIERGAHMCGELTMILVLMYHMGVDQFLYDLKDRLESIYENEMVIA